MVDLNAPLDNLLERGSFPARHIGPDAEDVASMLQVVGSDSLDALIEEVTPASVRTGRPLDLPDAMSETEALAALRAMAGENKVMCSMIGRGYYGTATPPVILRNLLENPGWYTAYTPYQAEVSQGRLEALLNFQQVVMDLTGLELANASLLDEATAAAEAMTMLRRVGKSRATSFFVDADTHPQTIEVLRTRAAPMGLQVVVGDPDSDLVPAEVFGALLSYPGSSGEIRDPAPIVERLHAAGALVAVATDLLALTVLTPPGELGADVAVGSAQRFGVPMGYGGPHAAFFATREAFKRSVPGRIIGVSTDANGAPALRMALQTREQHIRRDKATSNICTAQALLAIMASMYAVWHGPEGLARIAARTHRMASVAAAGLARIGLKVETSAFFDTITLSAPGRAEKIVANAAARGVNLRPLGPDRFALSVDETTEPGHVEALFAAVDPEAGLTVAELEPGCRQAHLGQFARRTPFLTHPVFASYRSETEMMRYLRRLQAKDIALDRSMIPLGSCTMKLNAAAEMIPVTWPEFGAIHPYAPLDQVKGYRRLFEALEAMLAEITGFDAVSLQPNAGSQGEYAGLLAIRRYHAANGEAGRDVCLIPASAHGTNPASAVMAGMKVVGVACDDAGNVDVMDLRAKIDGHRDTLGALMITYPSTHGVFEEAIVEICEAVHEAGGQVYIDGANLNAMVGLARVAEIGGDVCHMNLHKTFCIPHGGGGPGVGPIGMKAHLAPYAPGDPEIADSGAVAAAPFGSASILPISWAYIAMMGGEGLTHATRIAILNGNYVAARLGPHYPIVYTGANGRVAHECIIDLREMSEACGVTVDDVAKRLIDFGYHAPTMSWPVPGTLMIEPTESEGRAELDRFCDALIAIRAEIAGIEAGAMDVAESALRHAPHGVLEISGDWDRSYSRETAAFPAPWTRTDKFWPPVGRVDNVAGDRVLVCACPPMSAYAEAAE